MFTEVPGQELLFDLQYSNSSIAQFSNSVGFDIGYSKKLKSGNKLGLRLASLYNPFEYDYIRTDPADPISFVIKEVKPNSFWFSLQGIYSFHLYEKESINIYLGSFISLNYFLINESIHRLPNGSFTELIYDSSDQLLFRPGIGLMFESQLENILFKNLDLLYSFSPTIGSFEKFPAMGSIDPWFCLSMDFKVGICYSLKVKQ